MKGLFGLITTTSSLDSSNDSDEVSWVLDDGWTWKLSYDFIVGAAVVVGVEYLKKSGAFVVEKWATVDEGRWVGEALNDGFTFLNGTRVDDGIFLVGFFVVAKAGAGENVLVGR